MRSAFPSFPLRPLLLVDACTCVAMGALLASAATPLAALTEISRELLLIAGIALFPTAAFMAFTGTRRTVPAWAVRLIVLGNVLWVAGSVWLLLSDRIAPNGIGVAFVAAQAFVVAVLAALESRAAPTSERHAGALARVAD